MPDEFIGIDVQGIPELVKKLDQLPDAVADAGIEAVNEYFVDSLRHYPSYRKVTRKAAYGKTFQSDKMRRWFFAALNSGELQLPYKRTQRMAQGWKALGTGRNQMVVNETPYADWLQGDHQARMMGMIGWQKLDDFVKQRLPRIIEKFEGAVKKAIRKVGLNG